MSITNLDDWRDKDCADLLQYLEARRKAGDLPGLVIQSLGGDGIERVHLTGIYKNDKALAAGAMLTMSIRMTAAVGGFSQYRRI